MVSRGSSVAAFSVGAAYIRIRRHTPGGDVTEVWLVAEAADAGAGAGAEGNAALEGGADEAGEDGRGLAEGVGGRAVVFRLLLRFVRH